MKKLLVLMINFFILFSCFQFNSYNYLLLKDENKNNVQLKNLYSSLFSEDSEDKRYFLNNQIIQILKDEDKDLFDLYMEEIVNRFPNDKYNGYYYTVRGQNAEEQKNKKLAEIYYTRVVEEFKDLIINDSPIKSFCMEKVILLTTNSQKKIKYLNQLAKIENNPEKISEIYYYLGKESEALGNWSESLNYYEIFLKSKFVTIADNPNAYSEINRKLNIKNFKNTQWAYSNLTDLIDKIKLAITTKNLYLLRSLQSEAGFFACSWTQEETEAETSFRTGMGSMLAQRDIKVKPFLDPISNEKEAYLETWNWEYRINKWFFYFKKIDYPADPEINGKWEWAGIYLGDKHWTSSTGENF